MTAVTSTDPRTGRVVTTVADETTTAEVDRIARLAAAAAPRLERLGRPLRAGLLRALAEALEADRATIVDLADRETALGPTRLNGELTRTCYQLRLFADAVEEGGYLEAIIDHAGDTQMGPRPDLRRMLVPIGPVAVFGASNFPLAFSVPGGDTAAALAAGCPVVVKAHPSHPATGQRTYEVMRDAAARAGAPDGTIGLVHGQDAGVALVEHPAIKAVGFTGSLPVAGHWPTSRPPGPSRSRSTVSCPVSTRSWSPAPPRSSGPTRSVVAWPVRRRWARASSAPSRASCSCRADRTVTGCATRRPRRSPGWRRDVRAQRGHRAPLRRRHRPVGRRIRV